MSPLNVFPLAATTELRGAIEALDLTMPIMKLMDPKEGKGWSAEKVRRLERDYKRFLWLTVTRQEPIIPTKEIDDVWHAHILDTRKYAEDCARIFGAFLHHFPYFGLRGTEDRGKLDAAFSKTNELWATEFSDATVNAKHLGVDCSSCGAGSCGGAGCVNSACSGDGITQTSSICGGGSCDAGGGCGCDSLKSETSAGARATPQAVQYCDAFKAALPPALPVF